MFIQVILMTISPFLQINLMMNIVYSVNTTLLREIHTTNCVLLANDSNANGDIDCIIRIYVSY